MSENSDDRSVSSQNRRDSGSGDGVIRKSPISTVLVFTFFFPVCALGNALDVILYHIGKDLGSELPLPTEFVMRAIGSWQGGGTSTVICLYLSGTLSVLVVHPAFKNVFRWIFVCLVCFMGLLILGLTAPYSPMAVKIPEHAVSRIGSVFVWVLVGVLITMLFLRWLGKRRI